MKSIPKMGILNKGLYGTLKGARGWEVWIEKKLAEINFTKCAIPRSVYIREDDGIVTRLLRHSDDFRMSSKSKEKLNQISKEINDKVRMSDWKECERFLGVTIENITNPSGNYEDGGNICIIRCEEKIIEMHLKQIFNPKKLTRKVPLPLEFIKSDDELDGIIKNRLNDAKKREYIYEPGLFNCWSYCCFLKIRWKICISDFG